MTTGRAVDRAGFHRRWGVHVVNLVGCPWVSFGIHFDWHTPTLDLFLGKATIQVGRNNWDGEGRFSFGRKRTTGHTDQCMCEP